MPTKPSIGGSPAIDIAAMTAAPHSTGIWARSPLSLRRSRVPVAWSIAPTTRKRHALKSECAKRIVMPASAASGVPAPVSTTRKPSWLTVP